MVNKNEFAETVYAYNRGELTRDDFQALWREMESQFNGTKFNTSLGEAVVTKAVIHISTETPPVYLFEWLVEFAREDKLFRVKSPTSDAGSVSKKLIKLARTYATKEAARILRREDIHSGVRETRKAAKFNSEFDWDSFFGLGGKA